MGTTRLKSFRTLGAVVPGNIIILTGYENELTAEQGQYLTNSDPGWYLTGYLSNLYSRRPLNKLGQVCILDRYLVLPIDSEILIDSFGTLLLVMIAIWNFESKMAIRDFLA